MTLNILLMCNKPQVGQDANTIVDHIEAIEHYSSHRIWLCSNLGTLSTKLDLDKFDVIIIHYSLTLLNPYYISHETRKRLRAFNGLKVIFIQDEYRQINTIIQALAYLKIDVLFTCFPEQEFDRIYPRDILPDLSKFNTLTGYIPQRLLTVTNQPPIHERALHVGYRARKLPFWYGELAYEKWNIVEKWLEHTKHAQLVADVSYREKDRLYGPNWVRFITSCKTMLGVESGASVMDFTGEIEKAVDLHQLTHPHDTFQDVQKKYLLAHEGQHALNQISPRCFEAIALKTVLVLYEGDYSGILVPGRHYIALKKDFSNLDSVVAQIKDDAFLQNMADVAYQEIALNPKYSYSAFVEQVDGIITQAFLERQKEKRTDVYEAEAFVQAMKYIPLKNKLYKKGLQWVQALPPEIRTLIKCILRPNRAFKSIVRGFFLVITRVKGKSHGESQ